MRYDVQEIKRIASCIDVCRTAGLEPNAKGFVCCPFHGEKTGSCRVWADHFHCYGCGKHGDVIDLAAQLWDVPFQDAVKSVAAMYGIAESCSDIIRQKQKAAERKRTERAERIERLRQDYDSKLQAFRLCEMCKEQYAPRSPTDSVNPLFTDALHNFERLYDDMKQAEWALIDAELHRI